MDDFIGNRAVRADDHDGCFVLGTAEDAHIRYIDMTDGQDRRRLGDDARLVPVDRNQCMFFPIQGHFCPVDFADFDFTATQGDAEDFHLPARRAGHGDAYRVGMVHFFIGPVEFNSQALVCGNGKGRPQADIVGRKAEQAGDEGPVRTVTL